MPLPTRTSRGTSTAASDPAPANGSLVASIVMQAVAKGGPIGGATLIVAGLGELGVLKEQTAHGLAWLGAGLTAISIWWQGRRNMSMTATVGASSEISRAVIANAVTPPEITIVPTSPDPAVQREIQKQLTDAATGTP